MRYERHPTTTGTRQCGGLSLVSPARGREFGAEAIPLWLYSNIQVTARPGMRARACRRFSWSCMAFRAPITIVYSMRVLQSVSACTASAINNAMPVPAQADSFPGAKSIAADVRSGNRLKKQGSGTTQNCRRCHYPRRLPRFDSRQPGTRHLKRHSVQSGPDRWRVPGGWPGRRNRQ